MGNSRNFVPNFLSRETEILDVAPIDFINGLSKHFAETFPEHIVPPNVKSQAIETTFHWVSEAGPATPSRLTSGISLLPTDSFETCPPLDIVLIGAHNMGYTPNAAELAFVRKSCETCTAFLTICGGIEVPLHAGLLNGKKATGPRFMLDMLRHQAPTTEWQEKRWVQDGKLWTSGALLNGTDMMQAFAKHVFAGSQDESLVGYISKLGGWPDRDIDYKDVPWKV